MATAVFSFWRFFLSDVLKLNPRQEIVEEDKKKVIHDAAFFS